ncbi:hypothetical protein [Lonepinella sp. MS14435]|uniref:hypothetical protein n=1 Tax=unclassified Lonepinella TaxID=2642006 RepID=UPI0036D7BC27
MNINFPPQVEQLIVSQANLMGISTNALMEKIVVEHFQPKPVTLCDLAMDYHGVDVGDIELDMPKNHQVNKQRYEIFD